MNSARSAFSSYDRASLLLKVFLYHLDEMFKYNIIAHMCHSVMNQTYNFLNGSLFSCACPINLLTVGQENSPPFLLNTKESLLVFPSLFYKWLLSLDSLLGHLIRRAFKRPHRKFLDLDIFPHFPQGRNDAGLFVESTCSQLE